MRFINRPVEPTSFAGGSPADPSPKLNSLQTLPDTLINKLLSIPGVEEKRSRWQESDALWYRGKEVLHFDRPNLVDLRLGRRAIRVHREEQLKDSRVTIRGQSDWMNVRVVSPEDVEFVVGLVRDVLVE